ncbi:DUF1232 domain-containing protein [Microcoleus sp. FACHB-1515]|uniref:YkvA family protein n=1 Tax=Cyanophyceae TaxID=3028117 RepID=UPI001684FBB2|nr:DUF1232 domain-containing protein [Microcoleus sp. FACHB-1515]MBD2091006.1 DUF1232 domain-containing protein [Microcoleus sp. FACHB-1515]
MASPDNYTDQNFWEKLRRFAAQAGREVVEKALMLYYAAQRPETPLWAKTVIYSALAYFVLPTDAIPDLTPIAGYADDLGALAAALTTVAMCITPEVKRNAKQQLEVWFGKEAEEVTKSAEPVGEIPIE